MALRERNVAEGTSYEVGGMGVLRVYIRRDELSFV